MSKAFKLSEVVQPEFRTSEVASKKNEILAKNLGTTRYGPARLALAVSLADKRPVKAEMSDVKGNTIRGRNLFGDDADMAAWIALITEHEGRELDKQAFTTAVAAHWERGIGTLSKMWEGAGGDLDKFITALAEKSGMPREGVARAISSDVVTVKYSPPGAIDLHLGEFHMGSKQGQSAQWRMNAPGHPPHIAVMGAPNTGKTRLALDFAESAHEQSNCAAFVFDMGKGDIAGDADFRAKIGAEVIVCPGTPIPLDILHVPNRKDKVAIQNTATRLCDSVGFVTQGARGPVQTNRLRQVAAQILAQSDGVSIPQLRDAYCEESAKEDSVSAALDRLCDFNLFTPDLSPAKFFSRNWIFDLHNAAVEIQKFSAMMILDALNRHFAQLPNTPTDSDGNRQMTALLLVDEAHKILGFQHPALSEIIRLSRSKGGAVILISQSPNDYVREDANFVENIGLIASYQTNATQASINKVFSTNVPVANLGKGICAMRIFGESPQKVKVWE